MNNTDSKAHLILFDCDGTLTDSHGAIVSSMQMAFATCGLDEPSGVAVSRVIGLSLQAAVEALTPDTTCNARIIEAYRRHYTAAEASLSLYPGVIETLKELQRRGYWMGIVTGKSKPGLMRVLKLFDLTGYFLVLRTADCCLSKPHPAMALECMQELGVLPERTTLVGDAVFDMQMAASANVRPLGVSFGVESAEVLYAQGAVDVADDFPALLAHFPPLM
ncbi:MAG: HAD-IA family hydrolase [Mariprofundaceae bacterium]|nr:HAD-IA family hydrolase [Mariprofundaceae bacterium]